MKLKDTNTRSLIKSISWGLVTSIDTFFLSLLFTKELEVALYIGTAEIVTKIGLYFLHERIWNKFDWGHSGSHSSRKRSMVKSISWRIAGTIDTTLVALLFTANSAISFSIGAISIFTKLILYYLHERVWTYTKWGRILVVDEIKNIEMGVTSINDDVKIKSS